MWVAWKVPCALRSDFPPPKGDMKYGGEVYWRRQGGLPFLPEEVEARAVLPLGAGPADAGRQNPVLPDAAVGGLYESYLQYNLHLPAGTWVWLLPILRKAAGDVFKRRLCLNPEKSILRGDEGSAVSKLV